MKVLLTILILSIFPPEGFNDIAKINSLKKDAEAAFKKGAFEQAVESYSYLLDTLQVEDELATMNLAHAYYKLGETESAQQRYQRLVLSKDQKLKSLAYQQLGVISNDPQTLEKATAFFKESIKSDPTNEDARYNYELVKKKLEEQQNQDEQEDQNQEDKKDEQNQDKKNQDNEENQEKNQENKENQEQQDQEKQDQEQQQDSEQENQEENQEENEQDQNGDEKEQEGQQQNEQEEGEQSEEEQKEQENKPSPTTAEKLEEMNLTEEKAKMILEALKNSEVQYIQQNRRRPTKKKDSNKPDW